MNRYLKSAAAAALLALASTQAVQAEDSITIMVGGINKIIYLPARLTEQLGYFRDEGLNVKLMSEPAGVNAENEMLAGAVNCVVGFYDHTIDLQSKGKEVESIVQFAKVPGEVELVSVKEAASIRTPADFRGKTLGVTGLGSSTDFLTQYMAVKSGLKSNEYTVLPVGAGNTFIAAMQQGRIAAGMTTDPTVTELLNRGQARILVDMRNEAGTKAALGGLYPAASLYASTAWVNGHLAEVRKLARAFVKTMKYINTHTAEEIADKMPTDYHGGNRALYVAALKASMPMFTPDGRMPAGGPETVLKVLATFKPNIRPGQIDLSKTYTTQFVDAARN